MPELIFRPSSDLPPRTSSATPASCSSGSSRYSLINEAECDNDATYIYAKASTINQASANTSSWFGAAPSTNPSSSIKLKSLKFCLTTRVTNYGKDDGGLAFANFSLTMNGTKLSCYTPQVHFTDTNWGTCTTNFTKDSNGTSIEGFIIDDISSVDSEFFIGTTGGKGSAKNDSFEIRITQLYAVLIYEEISGPEASSGIHLKQNGAYAQAKAIWKKTNEVWSKTDKTAIDATKKYRLIKN